MVRGGNVAAPATPGNRVEDAAPDGCGHNLCAVRKRQPIPATPARRATVRRLLRQPKPASALLGREDALHQMRASLAAP